MEGVMAVVTCFAADFAPKNWAYCNGQILPIAQNQALFSLLGTTYGGNGVTTFALPDLRGRTALSTGQASGGSNYTLGQLGGTENVTLLAQNLPAHVHNGTIQLSIQADSNGGTETDAAANYPAGITNAYMNNPPATVNFATPTYQTTIQVAGGNQPVPVRVPYLVLNYVICMYGLFPSRN
jgi:microcystin-dependent protein